MKLKAIVITVLAGIIFTMPVQAEFVFLKNGSIIEGKIVADAADSVTVKDKENKVRTIPRNSIMRILYTSLKMGKIYIQKRDGEGIVAFMVDEDRDSYTFRKDLYKPEEFKLERSDVLFLAEKNPSGLKGVAEADSISLKWLPPYDSVKHYNVYYSSDKKEKYKLAGSPWGKSYTLSNLSSNKTYYIIVTSVDSDGYESSPSNELKITTPNIPPDAPGKVKINRKVDEKSKKMSVVLTWDAAADVDGTIKSYKVYQSGKEDAVTINKTEIEVKNLDPQNVYFFNITAVDDRDSESEKSRRLSSYGLSGYNFSIQPNYIIPLGTFKDVHESGLGALINMSRENTFIEHLDLGVALGYWQFTGVKTDTSEVEYSMMVPFTITAGYRINMFSSFYMIPRIALGGSYNYMEYLAEPELYTGYGLEKEEKTKWSVEPLVMAGLMFEYDITHRLYITAGGDAGMVIEMSGIIPFASMTFGAGVRF
jgi:hypothetical protein